MNSSSVVCKGAIASVLVCFVAARPSSAAVIYVDDSAIRGAHDGSSWANAFADLQAAIAAAHAGDELRVAQGTYRPVAANGLRTASFVLPNAVGISGGYAGLGTPNPDELDPALHLTLLSGDLNGNDTPDGQGKAENSYHVVVADGVGAQTKLSGVTIAAGNANTFSGICSPSSSPNARGAGLWCKNSASLVVEDCAFIDNAAICEGAGVSASGGSPVFRRCVFSSNRMSMASGGYGAGSAVAATGSPLLDDCQFVDNGPAEAGGAASMAGGILRDCFFEDNSANDGGAVIGLNFAAVRCTFIHNGAMTGGGAFWGYNASFTNCSFLGNVAGCASGGSAINVGSGNGIRLAGCLFSGNHGGAAADLVSSGSQGQVVNCTFVGNDAESCGGPGGLAVGSSVTLVANNIFWNNVSDFSSGSAAQAAFNPAVFVLNNIIEGYSGVPNGAGNFAADPLFIDANGPDGVFGTADDDARLSDASPARDHGANGSLPADQFDADEDGNVSEPLPLDLDLQPRIVNGIVDLGAIEHQGPHCVSDIAPAGGDGVVNVDDLFEVINAWGACGGATCAADIDNSGVVDVDDLFLVINNWGDCP